jgi:PAS domain S-box-containing protein
MDALLNVAPCGFLSLDEESKILEVNETLAHWLVYQPQKLVGQPIQSIYSVGSRVFHQTHFFPLLKLQGYAEEIYLSLRSANGDTIPVLTNAKRREHQGHIIYDCAIMRMRLRNEYENKILRAKRAAEEASEAKAEILTMLSQEFRTPLNAIVGFTEILAMEAQLSEIQKQYLKQINTGSEEILGLVTNILNFAQIEMGQLITNNSHAVSVNEVLANVEALMAPRLGASGIRYHRDQYPESIVGIVDPSHLQQALTHLLDNAIKFMEGAGKISVRCYKLDRQVLIEVHDTGPGIAKSDLCRIFEPFIQLNRKGIRSNQKGAGLGLAISRSLARAMYGDILVRSTVGKGSVFTLAIPDLQNINRESST